MKKLFIIALTLVLTLSLAACGRKNKNDNTTTVPTTESSILPDMDPTIDTNIPDNGVTGAVPNETDGIGDMMDDITDPMGTTDTTTSTNRNRK